MPDAFIWYHADESLEPELLNWITRVEEQAGVRGKLLVRIENNETTFMETYSNISRATINRIEKLANAQPVFDGINRRCENFVEIG